MTDVPAVGTAFTHSPVGEEHRPSRFRTTADAFSPSTFGRRRRELVERIPDGVAILFGAKSGLDAWEEHRFDPHFRLDVFRQEENLFYLTGLELPGAAAVIDLNENRTAVYLPAIDGRASAATARLGIGEPRPLKSLEGDLRAQIRRRPVYLLVRTDELPAMRAGFAERTGFPRLLAGALPNTFPDERLRARLEERFAPVEVRSLLPALTELRRVKDEEEIAAMRDATAATVAGFRAGIACIAPDVDTREVIGEMERAFKRAGAQRTAFPAVVQSGADAMRSFLDAVDSYDGLNRTMAAGELVLLDHGAEMNYYRSDLARTVPISGEFSPDQRAAYDTYLLGYEAGLDMIRPGSTLMDAAEAVGRTLRAEAPGLPGWLRDPFSTFAEAVSGYRPGHFIGLALHDHEDYRSPLRPGEVVAYEHHFRIPERGWRITAEDVVLVTERGHEVLSAGLPRLASELESLMAEARER